MLAKRTFSKCTAGTLLAGALAAVLLASCSDTTASRFLVAPGKYVFYNCAQIVNAAKANSVRQHQLEELMAKAGEMASAVAYRPEYLQLRGQLADMRQEAAEKKCNFVPGEEAAPRAVSGAAIR